MLITHSPYVLALIKPRRL